MDFQNLKTTPLANATVEIEGEIKEEAVENARNEAIKSLSQKVEIEGFRKGKVPEAVLIKNIGEGKILEKASQIALQKAYPAIIKDQKIDAIGYPEITVTKLAKGNPLGFKIKVAIMPTVKLPDYKKIAKKTMEKKDDLEVTDKDVEEALEKIRKNKVLFEANKKGQKVDENNLELPELNDEFAKSLGDFKDVADLKKKLKENMKQEKEFKAKDAKRAALVDKLIVGSSITMPDMLVEGELAKMLAGFKDDIAKAGLKYEDYLKQIGKTEEDIRKEWRETATKKAKLQLILNKIAEEEKLEADKTILEAETKKLQEMYKEADPMRVRAYVETQLINQKVFEFLENQK